MKSKNQKINKNQKIRMFVLFFGILAAAVFLFSQFQPTTKADISYKKPEFKKENGFRISGSIFALTFANEKREDTMLPDIDVFLRNTQSNTEIGRTKTDENGKFRINEPIQDGEFTVCWESKGWSAECDTEKLSANSPDKYFTPIELKPLVTKSAAGDVSKGVIVGRVVMADGLPCTHQNKNLGISQETMIEVSDDEGNLISPATKTNTDGGFAITDLGKKDISIKASCGESVSVSKIRADNTSLQGISVNSLKINNHNPVVTGIIAYDGNTGIKYAREGQKIKLVALATDKDKDSLTYNFIAQQNGGTLEKSDKNTVEWQLPKQPGAFRVYVIVTDNKGGVSFNSIYMLANNAVSPVFSGTVVDEANTPLKSANVEINGKIVQTTSTGAFKLGITESLRYVMNISKAGYVPVSRVFDRQKNGFVWKLRKAFTTTIDPLKGVKLIEPARDTPQGLRKGSTLVITANNLVNRRTKALATRPLQLSMATLDIANGEMPGDNGAISAGGRPTVLMSFGAVFIEVKDDAGDFYDIAKVSKTNTLTLPVEPAMIRTAPRTITSWSFNPIVGTWASVGVAQLAVDVWQMQMPPVISIINADLEFTTPACIQVDSDNPLIGLKARFNFAGFAQTFDLPLDDQFTMIHHVPQHVATTVKVIDSNNNELTNAIIKIGGSTVPNPFDSGATTTPFNPPYPYSSCDQKIRLEIVLPTILPNFLTYKGVGDDFTSQAYIDAIDPQNLRNTLGDWWLQNGFDLNGDAPGQHEAAYFNNNDLHFGREMHCVKDTPTVGDVACYVSNYGNAAVGGVASADLAQNALNNPANKSVAGATVTMEYRVIEGRSTRIVKFLAYSGGVASSTLFLSPDLDGNGPKGMPQLCLTCHGGNYFPSNPLAPTITDVEGIEASFREFDLDSFLYPSTNSRAAQEAEFQQLNNQAVYSAPRYSIQDLVTGWYSAGLPQNGAFVPTGYSAQANLYSKVVATSCRTCHIAQPDSTNASSLDFATYTKFHNVVYQGIVCGPNKQMPQAEVTFENFWLSTNPARPQLLSQTLFGSPCLP